MLVVTSSNFEQEVIQSKIPVLVDFGATWCPPCKALLPILEEMDATANNQYKIVKVDIDEQPELASRFAVSSIPTLLLFKEGQQVNKLIGFVKKEKLEQILS